MARKPNPDPSGRTHVALFRGINVGGKNRLPMAELTALFSAAGAREVATYIQSGNVAFAAAALALPKIIQRVGRGIASDFGFEPPIVVRTVAELEATVGRNPFLPAEPEDSLHVGFLADRPRPIAVGALDHQRSPGDRFAVVERDIYLCLPNGVGKSKLTNAYFDSKLGTVSTIRNWRTVLALLELLRGGSAGGDDGSAGV